MNEACSHCPLVIDCVSRSSSNAQDILLYQESLMKLKDLELTAFLESTIEDDKNKDIKLMLDEVRRRNSNLVDSQEVNDLCEQLDKSSLLRNEFMSDLQNQIKTKEEKIKSLQDEQEFYDQFAERLILNCQKGPRFIGKQCQSDLINPK